MNKRRIFVIFAFLILSFALILYGSTRNQAKFTVTFIDGYNDKVIEKIIVRPGEDVEVPEAPKHDGFVFGGWYLYGSDTPITEFDNIEDDLKVEAKYKTDKNKNGIADDVDTYYTVRFIDGVTGEVLKTEIVLVGMGATAPIANVHENYTFTGWNKEYSKIQSDLDVISVYTRENLVTMYTLNFYDKEGNIFTTQRIAAGNVSGSVVLPEYEGYTFEGWYLNQDHTVRYELGSIVLSNLNIYGNWTINNYKVEFDVNGGTATGGYGPIDPEINANYGDKIKLPDAERIYVVTYHGNPDEGTIVSTPHGVEATFLGWCKGNNITCLPENLIAPNTEVEVKDNTVYVAYWGESQNKITLGTASRNNTSELEFTFNGWALTKDAEVKDYNAGDSITLNENIDLYALWNRSPRKYTITFNSNGGSEVEPLTLNYNDEIDLSEITSERTGYTFKGWKLVEGSIPTTMPDYNFEIIATWEINEYTLTFMNGDNEILKITQDYNTEIIAPQDLVKEGYTFSWDKEIPATMPANDLIINAIWTIKEYTVSFNHRAIIEWEIGRIKVPYGSTLPIDKIPNVQLPVPAGHKVVWETKNGTEWNLATDIVKSDLKLYANLKPITYTVQFNFVDGNNVIKTVNYGKSLTPPRNTEKQGYTCKWDSYDYLLVNGNKVINELCTKNKYKLIIKNIYRYETILWREIEYKTEQIYSLEYESMKEIPIPTRKGYEFAGWTVKGAGSSVDGTTFTMGYENATLTAIWNEESKYMAIFNSNGGSDVATVSGLSKNSLIPQPANPTKGGYTFGGWYKEESLENPWNFDSDKITTNTTLYAKWNINQYTVTFINTDGNTTNVEFSHGGTIITPSIIEKSGYICEWKEVPLVVTEDLTITAECIKNSYNLIIDANGGIWSGTTPIILEYESVMTINNPTRDGYTFDGWMLTGAGSSIDNTTFIMGYENATLTAKWLKNYKLTIEIPNGNVDYKIGNIIKTNVGTQVYIFPDNVPHITDIELNNKNKTPIFKLDGVVIPGNYDSSTQKYYISVGKLIADTILQISWK